ncbi:aldo/keto reductase [Pseudogracilibacillus auburnensis]|uniref:Aryl-alcohol dehydrogenase-like predicted oxidoreductase n=1 Tax=Pseudogracilibacillus auburnensis TaxID=1494959 RepID=A0A2V3W8V8_9BACI|nr:aryl-alcohol dehydrogenase-like predicted oxidoreductase [Pseudogracilibacillus auburnensis]
MLKKNRLGKSNLFVTPLTLGCMSLGTNRNKAINMLHHAIDSGINHVDTADLYGFGENEKIVGEAIKQKREKIVLTTKVGNHFDKQKRTWFWDPRKEYIEKAVDDSLKRLQTDYIDLYLLHGGTMDDDMDDTIEAFERLKSEGKIRAYGISSIRPNVINEYMNRANIDVVMMQYSMLDRRPEELLDMLNEKKISVLARGPLAKGILSNDSQKLHTKGMEGFVQYSEIELKNTIQHLSELNESITTLAFQFVLQHPAVASCVFGASTMNQLEENIRNSRISPMKTGLYEQIKKITKQLPYEEHRIR